MKFLRILLLAAFFTLAAIAADVSGTWEGTFKISMPDGTTNNDGVHLILKQDGTKLTGTGGPSADRQLPISNGSVAGNAVRFEIATPDGGSFRFDVALQNDRLQGDVSRTLNGQSMNAKMDAGRAK